MAKFMVILHNTPAKWRGTSAEEMQQKIQQYQAWVEKLRAGGRYVGGEKLGDEGGKVLTLQNGRPIVVDGPYPETKEVLGGFTIFRAADYDEALELLRGCPFLADGTVVLRRTDPMGCGGE